MSRRTHWSLILVAVAGMISAAGCSGNNDDPDAGGDGGSCVNPCILYSECGETEDCIEGCCKRSARCTQNATCQPGGLCVDGRCVGLCLNDTDCTDQYSCVSGFCEPYPQDVLAAFQAPEPNEGGTKQALQVGIGDVALDFPVGVSMAGYGARAGPRTPYRNTLGGSERVWDKPRVKAYVLDNGEKRVVLVRLATSWSTDQMVTRIAYRLYQETGENYLNNIITSANHTHSYPGRYSFWVADRSFGVLGHGDYSHEMMSRHVDAGVRAILAAIADLQPSRLAWAYEPAMDPEHKIHQYRRTEYPQGEMDDSLVTIRIDDEQGNPRAVLFNFGIHGTHSDDTAVTGDAPGAIEIIAERNIQELTGLPVKVTFLSGNSGDVSPAGDGSGLDDWRKIQQVGHLAWPVLKAQYDALEGQSSSDVDLDIASIRAPINREALGYGPGQFVDEEGNEYLMGAFQCVGDSDEDPNTVHEDGDLGCIFSAEMLSGGVPVPGFGKVRMSSLKINDLGFVTVPGEPLSTFGKGLAQAMVDAGFTTGHVLGYSQDHHLYIMHSDNWMQGGYEPSMGIWGWAEGDYFFDQAVAMIQRLASEGGFVDDQGMLPSFFEWPDDTVQPTVTGAGEIGQVLTDAPAVVERVSKVTLIWTGGHPGVDLPTFTLEREDGGNWAEVVNAAGSAYTCDLHSSMLWYLGDYDLDHSWMLEWEEGLTFPLGTYRLRIDGHYFDGSGTQTYQTTSQAFDFQASSRMVVSDLQLAGDQISGTVRYPAGPTNDDGVSEFENLKPSGYLFHSSEVPPNMPFPTPADGSVTVDASITPPNGGAVSVEDLPASGQAVSTYSYVSARDDQGVESTSQADLPGTTFSGTHAAGSAAGTYNVTATVSDAHGNTGSAEVQIQVQ